MIALTDSELTLSSGEYRAVLSPLGASLRRYFRIRDGIEIDVVWGYSGAQNKKGGQGDVLMPFPGRIAYGRYSFNGQEFQLPCNDKEGPNAIHGFARTVLWELKERSDSAISFEHFFAQQQYAARGYPFSLRMVLTYRLEKNSLTSAFVIENKGADPAPVGVGFHPYFTVGTAMVDEMEVKIPARHYLEMADTLAPTGTLLPVQATDFSADQYRRIGAMRFNQCFVNLIRNEAGICTVPLRNPDTGRTVSIEMDTSFTAFVLYTGDAIQQAPRRGLAIEPMTCASDAFNHPEWGLTRLAPGEVFCGAYKVLASAI
jgi:aldose 1-epimerase